MPKSRFFFKKIVFYGDIIERILKYFLLVIFSIMVSIVILQILRRSILGTSFQWSEELARYLFIWNIFIASAIGIKEKSHAAFEFFVNKFKSKYKYIVIILKSTFVIIFALTIIFVGFKHTITSFGSLATTFPISRAYIYLAIPLGGFFMFYYEFIELIRSILLIKGLDKIEKDIL